MRSENNGRVCIFSTDHSQANERVFRRQATALAENGYDVTFYTCRKNTDATGHPDIDVCIPQFVERERFDQLPTFFARVIFALLLTITLIREREYDVYHFHDAELLPFVALFSRWSDAVFIYDVHDNAGNAIKEKTYLSPSATQLASTVISTVDSVCSRTVDGVICASADIAETFDHHSAVQVISNYPRREVATRSYPAEREDESVNVVYGGLLTEKRGILNLIAAVEDLPEEKMVTLQLYGWFRASEIEQRVKRHELHSDRVEFCGYVPPEEILERYYHSDIGVVCHLPSAQNQCDGAHRSNKLFQYMAAGLPVIVPDLGNWPALVHEYECGVAVNPTDVDELSAAIDDLVENDEKRTRLGANAREAVCTRFNWETEEEKLIAFYESLS